MERSLFIAILSLFLCYSNPAVAQLKELIDSMEIDSMQHALNEARITEMNLRMEMEALRNVAIAADSAKRAEQMRRIDSLRSVTPATPVVVEGDTLYYIYAKRGGVSPKDRATGVAAKILSLGKQFQLSPDSVYIELTDIAAEIMYNDKVIASFTELDGLWQNTTRDELASDMRVVIVKKLVELQKKHGLSQLIRRTLLFILVLLVQGLLIWGTTWLFRRGKHHIGLLKESKLKPIKIRNYVLLNTQKQGRILTFLASLVRYFLIFIQLLISVPIMFSIFPQTENLSLKIFSYIWNPVKHIAQSIIAYIPNLFTILIIWLSIRYLVKGIRYLANEIQSGRLKITGFYADWAHPTYQIARFLLYAFMIAMIYPYLPNSNSRVFQGVSVFVGLIVSFGSTSVIGNIIAGMVITYMRPFHVGDRIRLNDTEGNVLEKTPFATRLLTPKNEIVTIPNSFVMSSHTVNYSASARDLGLIIHLEVSFGYDTYWVTAHELLITAALRTPGVVDTPKPFVLETTLHDFYMIYQINAYVKDANILEQIYSDLNQNIQDLCNEAGIELLSPHYYAERDGSEIAIPKRYKEKKA